MAQIRVSNPPDKPLVLFDGDCQFCRRWIERWRELSAGSVEYAPFQERGSRFPEVSGAEFEEALHFIDKDGAVYRGAEAVFRSLGKGGGGRALVWCYDH